MVFTFFIFVTGFGLFLILCGAWLTLKGADHAREGNAVMYMICVILLAFVMIAWNL